VVSDSQSRNSPRDYVRRGLGASVLFSAFVFLPVFLLLAFASSGYGFDSYQQFEKSKKQYVALRLEAMPDKEKVHPGETFWLHLVTFLDKGWHMYSVEKQSDDKTVATRIELEAVVFDPKGNWQESPPKLVRDEVMEKIMKTHSGRVEFTLQFSVPNGLKPGAYPLSGTLHFRTCDNRICTLPQEMKFQTRVIVEAGEPG
jgi:Thiol:disulfide interchange protein DsbD, N-terminal